MPLALIIIAMLVFVIAVKGNYQQAGQLANQTFFGTGNNTGFLTWFFSIISLSIIFRVIRAPKAGEMFIGLVLLVYFIKNNNVLSQIESAIQSSAAPAQSTGASASSSSSTASTSSATSANIPAPAPTVNATGSTVQ